MRIVSLRSLSRTLNLQPLGSRAPLKPKSLSSSIGSYAALAALESSSGTVTFFALPQGSTRGIPSAWFTTVNLPPQTRSHLGLRVTFTQHAHRAYRCRENLSPAWLFRHGG